MNYQQAQETIDTLPDELFLRDGALEMVHFIGDDWETHWVPVKVDVPDERGAADWVHEMRQEAASRFVHEHPDGGWFVGSWDGQAGQWVRPLDAETERASGCYAEFSTYPFPAHKTHEGAISRALELYKSWIDRELYSFWYIHLAAPVYDVPTSSITWACREGQITGAQKTKSGWRFPLISFLDWMRNRPGSGRR